MRVIACVNAALFLNILAFSLRGDNKTIFPSSSYSLSIFPQTVLFTWTRRHARNLVHPSQEQLYTFRTINSNCLSAQISSQTCPKPGLPVWIRSCTSWRLKCAYIRVCNLSGNSKCISMHQKMLMISVSPTVQLVRWLLLSNKGRLWTFQSITLKCAYEAM